MSTLKIAVTDENPEFGSRIVNLIKINLLLSQANSLLQSTFKERWIKYSGSAWDDDALGNANRFINGIGQRFFRGVGKIQKDALLSGNVDNWDITMLTDILMYVDFDEAPDQVERQHLELLKQVRNTVAHNPQAGISDPDLEALWSKAEQVLLHFGWNLEEIQKLKNSTNVAEFENQNMSTVNNDHSKTAASLKDEGNNFHKRKEFKNAIDAYSKAIALDGLSQVDRGVLYSNRSASYLGLAEEIKNGKKKGFSVTSESARERAIEDAKEVMRLRPAWYKGYFRTGSAYHADRNYEKAVRSFDWALSLAPANEEIQAARYESRRKLGVDARSEHMDPTIMRSEEEQRKMAEEKFGRKISKKSIQETKEFYSKRIPGQADVFKGHDYFNGTNGMKQDDEAAVRCFSKATTAGNAEGIYFLGQMYKLGRGVPQDFAMAIKLFKEAAAKPAFRGKDLNRVEAAGVGEAEHALGLAYDEGVGVEQNYAEAFKWYERSSDHGCTNGSHNLAFMYSEGKGVPKDLKRAGQYWHLAATQGQLGNPMAMESLGWYYLKEENDPVLAKHWYELAIANGNLHAKLRKPEFDTVMKHFEDFTKKMEKEITEWETKQGLKMDDLTMEERKQRMIDAVAPSAEVQKVIGDMMKLADESVESSKTPVLGKPKELNIQSLKEFATMGSITAKETLEGLKHFLMAQGLVDMGLNADTWPLFCAELATCCRHDYKIIQFTPDVVSFLNKGLWNYMKTLPKNSPSVHDKNARACYAYINMLANNNFKDSLRFVEASQKKYPEEIIFHRLNSGSLAFLKDFKATRKVALESLEHFPGDLDLLYNVAAAGFVLANKGKGKDLSVKEVVAAFQDYLDAAPKDDRLVPHCYYGMALLLWQAKDDAKEEGKGTKNKRGLKQVKKYHQLGLAAEKEQLPWFLPYESNHKGVLESFFRLEQLMPQQAQPQTGGGKKNVSISSKVAPVKPTSSGGAQGAAAVIDGDKLLTVLTSPLRIKVVKHHRIFLSTCLKTGMEIMNAKNQNKSTVMANLSVKPRHKQGAPSRLAGLRSITFKDMNIYEDKVYKNCVLEVRSIEDPGDFRRPSIAMVVEDDNREAWRCCIYDFGAKSQEEVMAQLGVGAKLSIINPYMRIALDGGHGLRVDDPKTVFLHSGHVPASCRFCGNEDAKLKCGQCKRAFYCDAKCQEIDWKKFQHKLICTTGDEAGCSIS